MDYYVGDRTQTTDGNRFSVVPCFNHAENVNTAITVKLDNMIDFTTSFGPDQVPYTTHPQEILKLDLSYWPI